MPLMEEEENNILYELLVHYEWLVENELKNCDGQEERQGYKSLLALPSRFSSLSSFQSLNPWSCPTILPQLKRLINCGCSWHLGIGADGAVIAIVQQSCLEIRGQKDDYTSVLAKSSNFYRDPFPSWRKVAWCADCSMLALGYSNGVVEIFNLSAVSLFKVYPPRFQEGYLQNGVNDALASLFFCTVRTAGLKWVTEMVLIDFNGNVRSYFVSSTEGYQESTTFSLQKFYPSGITTAVNVRSLIIVAGHSGYEIDPRLKMNGFGHGLTVWRMLDEFPYYQQMPTVDQEECMHKSSAHILPRFRSVQHDAIFRLSVSPLGRQIAAVHVSGSISIWDLPSLRKRKFWLLKDQPNYKFIKNVRGRHIGLLQIGDLQNHPIDIKWWSENTIILSRLSGSVTVCSVFSLSNLLGGSPEFFEGVPQITDANDKCFLALEVNWHNNDSIMNDSVINIKENKGYKKLMKNVLYWATDLERFQPFQKEHKASPKTYRLLSLNSTTPDELYVRKIEMEEYGDALALAHKYSLDCDLVYHRQWCKNPVTTTTIHDYLSKIKKRSIVLSECMARVPHDIEAARELLLFGIRGTELDTLVAIKKGTDEEEFILSDLAMEYEEDLDWDDENSNTRIEEMAANDLQKRTELICQIDFFNLSLEQVMVIRSRQKLLFYYDRLGTYEAYLGGLNLAVENYDHKFYEKFRQQNDIEACLEFAREANWKGVEAMFTYHGRNTLKHKIAILSNFPPMLGPFEYRSLLPECDLSGEVFEWEQDTFRDADWCEDAICRVEDDSRAVEIEVLLYEDPSYLKQFKGVTLNADNVSQWYLLRAREIETAARFVDISLDLLRLARQRNIMGLQNLLSDMESLEVLIYEIGLSDISLNKFEKLNDLEKIKLFMSTSNSENHMHNLRCWGLPFLDKCEDKQPGVRSNLIKNYLVSTAKDDLSIVLKAIQHSQSDGQSQCILTSPEDILNVAIDSIYYCENPMQLPRAYAIVDNLPLKGDNKSEEMLALHQEVDILEDLLEVGEILSNYAVLETPKYLRSVQNDKNANISLLSKIARSFVKRGKPVILNDWKKLLKDAIEMQQKIFCQIELSDVYQIITDAMLTSGLPDYINYAREFMETRQVDESVEKNTPLKVIPYRQSLKLVMKAAIDYFNSAEAYNSDEINLARQCLKLIETEDNAITAELDLISGLQILPDFGLKLLPLQVRLCEDRLRIIEECISYSEVRYYHGARLLHLSKLFRVCAGDDYERESKVTNLLASAALKIKDYDSASIWCDQIVTKGYKDAWLACASLGRCREFNAIKLRAKLLDFSLAYADGSMLDDLLRDRNEIELSLLYASVQDQIQPNISVEPEECFEDAKSGAEESGDEFCDANYEDVKTSTPFSQIIETPIDITKGLLTATASRTSKIASTVTTRKFWKGASGWLSPFVNEATRKIMGKVETQENDSKNQFQVPSCHAFYKGLWPSEDISSLGISYRSYACSAWHTNTIFVPFNVLRIALMSENFSEVSSDQLNDYGVKKEIAKNMLLEDLPLGLSFILTVLSIEDAETLFQSLPQTELCLQVSLYYYSIQIYSLISPHKKSQISPLYLMDPSKLVQNVAEIVKEKDFLEDPVLSCLKDNFTRTTTRLLEFIESEDLRDLGSLVDIDRFLSDRLYKMDTLLGLALTSDPVVLQIAVKLAEKYDVPLSQIYLACLQFLFDSFMSINDIEVIIKDTNMVEEFKKNIEEFSAHMYSNIFMTISGRDYERIIYFFDIMLEVVGPNKTYTSYLTILSYLKKSKISLDFKAFMECDKKLLVILKPLLTSKNVGKFASFMSLLPDLDVTASAVYCVCAQESFFGNLEGKPDRTSRDWIAKFSSIFATLKKMDFTDIKFLLEHIFLSEETCSIPLEAKQEIIKISLKHCTTLKSQRPKASDQFDELIDRLAKVKSHLQHLDSPLFKSILRSDPPLDKYARWYERSGGDVGTLAQISKQILLDMCSINVLREVLAVYPEECSFVPEDIFVEVLREVLEKIAVGEDLMHILEHLLKEFVAYSEEGGELITEDDIIDKIRESTNNHYAALDCKVKILCLTQKFLTLDTTDVNALHTMKTGEIVQTVLSSAECRIEHGVETDNTEPNIQTATERYQLFEKLLSASNTHAQAVSIFELLSIWPPFDESTYSSEDNPWTKLIHKLVVTNEKDEDRLMAIRLINSLICHSKSHNQLNRLLLTPIISNLIRSQYSHCLLEVAKITLHHCDQQLIDEVISAFNSKPNVVFDEELFEIVLDKKLVPRFLRCTLYADFFSYLQENGSRDNIVNAASQLESNGDILEAASIRLLHSSLPTTLRTASISLLKALNKFV